MAAAAPNKAPAGGLAAHAAGLMFSLPFLVPQHQAPIPSFASEWLSLLLGTVLLGVCALPGRALAVPAASVAPLALAALVAVQYALGMFAYGASAVLAGACLLWAALLAMAGQATVQRQPAEGVWRVLAWWLLAGAVLNALAGWLQFSGAWSALGGLVAAPSPDKLEGVYGNLAQQNHFASQLAMGLGAALWLRQGGVLRGAALAAVVALLLSALAISGSRSGWLYLGVLGLILLAHATPQARRRLLTALALAALLLAALAWAAWLDLLGPQLSRLTRLGDPFGPRAFIWQHAWRMALAHPLLGVGWDAFAAALLEQLRPGEKVWGIDQYAHNLPLQLLAAGGVPAVLALLLPLATSLRRSVGAPMLGWAVLGVLAVHSLLEQPLYYAYFLGPAAFMLGAMERRPLWTTAAPRWALAVPAVLLLFGLGRAHVNYSEIQAQVYAAEVPPPPALVQRLHQDSLYAPLLELALPQVFVAPDAPLAQRLAFNDKVRHFAPVAEVTFRHAALLAETGRQQEAQEQLQRAARAYPADTPAYLARIAQLGAQQPQTYGALAAFAAAHTDWR